MFPFAKRIFVQTAAVLILFALIFVSAGTIDFWQGWLFCLVFLLSMIAIGIYLIKYNRPLLERRMRFGPWEESRPIEKVVITLTFLMFVPLIIVPALDHRFAWSRVPGAVVVIANILIVATFGIFLVVLHANSFAASTITVEAGQRVISTGPYAYVRHPMYTGAVLLIFAIPIALGSWWGLVIPMIATPILIVRIFDEERALGAELPGYKDYLDAVPYRLIPRVW
ncbi:MAG TPA: isoprenylcysteine carboxylmethyltransferase family protein [Candidatus Binataceae bacterium]|nr:isoprenylcysteine carboxylmethyltransferase family protein [Candidatus Binataceae bacterium]